MANLIEKKIKVRLTFIEPILGTAPANKDVYREFIGSKAIDASTLEDEVDALGVDEVADKGMTIFPKTSDGKPFYWDYQIKGFFKDSCGGLRRTPHTESKKITSYKKVIDKLIFVLPRKILIHPAGPVEECQRPLRAETMKGERVTLASSEEYPAGSWIEFEIALLDKNHEKLIREWLDYGVFSGIGQWRNSGMGRFEWEELE